MRMRTSLHGVRSQTEAKSRLAACKPVKRSSLLKKEGPIAPALMNPVPSRSSASHTARTVLSETASTAAPFGMPSWSLTR